MGKRKEFVGTVISDKMQKTRIVRVMRMAKHPKYGRMMRKYNKFKAHDEKNIAKVGDLVRIEETRPLSKDKRFRVVEVIKKAVSSDVELNPVRNTKSSGDSPIVSNGVKEDIQ